MNYNERLLFYLIRIGLETERMFDFQFTEMPDWEWIVDMSSRQGVLGVVYDGINVVEKKGLVPEDFKMCIDIRLQLKFNVVRMERVASEQYRLSREFAEAYAEHGITTVVFKGLSIARLYPNAKHRPCGDMDCFLMGDFEKGNRLAPEIGAVVGGYNIKHIGINYKGLEIENHQFFTHVYGGRRRVRFERELQKILYDGAITPIGPSHLYYPCVLFHAIFLAYHSWRHYISSKIGLRHICDWAVLMKHHCCEIDWERFAEVLDICDRRLFDYVRCMSVIAHRDMGAPLPEIFTDDADDLPVRVLKSVLYYEEARERSILIRRFITLVSLLFPRWEKRTFSEFNPINNTFMFFYMRYLNKHPNTCFKPDIVI